MRYPNPATATDTFPYYEYEESTPHVMRPLENEVWAAIRLLTVEGICVHQLKRRFPNRRLGPLEQLAAQIQSCLKQAEEYFWIAQEASSRVAPLLHYYSMLNLTKALIYLKAPERLKTSRDFNHGLIDPQRIKNPHSFSLSTQGIQVGRGVFSTLHYLLTGQGLIPGKIYNFEDLFKYCTWITNELEELGDKCRLVHARISIQDDAGGRAMRLSAELGRTDVLEHCRTLSKFAAGAPASFKVFTRVSATDEDTLRYESQPLSYTTKRTRYLALEGLRATIKDLRLFRHGIYPREKQLEYLVPLDNSGDRPLPEPCVLLGITFFIGSLVRYQPHIFDHLLGSEEAWLLESFIRQCPLAFSHIMLNHLWNVEHLFMTP